MNSHTFQENSRQELSNFASIVENELHVTLNHLTLFAVLLTAAIVIGALSLLFMRLTKPIQEIAEASRAFLCYAGV